MIINISTFPCCTVNIQKKMHMIRISNPEKIVGSIDINLNCEASSASFAVQEVIRESGTLCLHCISETSSLTADPSIRAWNAFRFARQGIHDAVGSAASRHRGGCPGGLGADDRPRVASPRAPGCQYRLPVG